MEDEPSFEVGASPKLQVLIETDELRDTAGAISKPPGWLAEVIPVVEMVPFLLQIRPFMECFSDLLLS